MATMYLIVQYVVDEFEHSKSNLLIDKISSIALICSLVEQISQEKNQYPTLIGPVKKKLVKIIIRELLLKTPLYRQYTQKHERNKFGHIENTGHELDVDDAIDTIIAISKGRYHLNKTKKSLKLFSKFKIK